MATREHIKLLQGMPFFGAINDDCVELILSLSHICRVKADSYFYHQGEEGDCLYVLEEGRVDIAKEVDNVAVSLCLIEQGGCFGELALIACTPRSASARAVEDCLAIRIPKSALHGLYEHDMEQFLLIQMNMAREVCRRLQEIDDLWVQSQINAGNAVRTVKKQKLPA